jgi:hypothetical protein
MNKTKFIFLILIFSLAVNIILAVKYSAIKKELKELKRPIEIQTYNEKVLNFTKFFIDKVLKAEGEVDFDTRLKLETAVRDLNDKEILDQWQKFVNSQTELQVQQEVKNLLSLLMDKIKSE